MLSRRSQWILILPLFAVLAGCHLRQMTDLAEDPVLVPSTSPMKIGEAPREFPVPADGEWHMTDILVMKDDLLLIEPLGVSGGLEDGALRCRAGADAPELWVNPKQQIRFPRLAPLELRVVSKQAEFLPYGKAEVRVTKIDEKIIR